MKTFSVSSHSQLEFILILSFISRAAVTVNITNNSMDYQNYVDFLLNISKGSTCLVSSDGQSCVFTPGFLPGGSMDVKTGDISILFRSIFALSPFMRAPLSILLRGVTNGGLGSDGSVDMLEVAYNRLYKAFKINQASLVIRKRGFAPLGEGLVEIRINQTRKVGNISIREPETYEKINGLVITARIGLDFTQRMVTAIKAEMECFGRVKVANILNNKNDSGPSPGYESSVYVEGDKGFLFSTMANEDTPESTALKCCHKLIREIDLGTTFSCSLNSVAFLFMALARGVSYLRLGAAADSGVLWALETLKEFLGTEYYLSNDDFGTIVKIVGCDYVNPNRVLE
ncbi:RNA 3'-terminal phosphate cyclase-like protein [Pancytospora epiphaga]|nr:RNA 3'-terminal phosphate cyclase-like protein [Pancytospora epiphaga]